MKKLIIILLAMIVSFAGTAQLTVTLGGSRTELRDAALTIGITYLRSFDSLFGDKRLLIHGKNSYFSVTPEVDIRMGSADAFSSINIKAAGNLTTYKVTTVAGLETPDFDRTWHNFPMAIGVETNNSFNNVNGIAEIGWVPYYQSYSRKSPDWIKKTNFGIALQGGYKFDIDTAGALSKGGEVDESEEKTGNGILRAKGVFSINTGELFKINGLKIGLTGTATGWYDILNTAIYHKIDARARFYLSADRFIDFIYGYGSGAPLFNNADEIGIGLTLRL